MQHRDLISGLFWLSIGTILSIWSRAYQVGSFIEPGPGFLPLLLGLLLIVFSITLLWKAGKSIRTEHSPLPFFTSSAGRGKVAYTTLVLLATAFFFEKVGYLITFFLLLVLLVRFSAGWKTTLLVAFFTVLGIYIIFVLLLGQQLPQGLLGL